ncbi:MAG: SUMF1/EgtB/PvdO family nonheme iron enzyme [Planctomycetota bacterium]|nr:SUMF1/EgtB/PvdO family nonheme iron enzyme [Planctomycetota bacterium]
MRLRGFLGGWSRLSLAGAFLSANALSAETVIVRVESARVMKGTVLVAAVAKGQKLEVLKHEGAWIGVAWRAPDGLAKKGWIKANEVESYVAPEKIEPKNVPTAPSPKKTEPESPIEPPVVKVLPKAVIPAESEKLTSEPVATVKPNKGAFPTELEKSFEVPKKPEDAHGNPVRQGIDKNTGWPLEIRHKVSGMHFVFIPAGEFMMGSPENENNRSENEKLHTVVISKPFYLGKYEVTQEECKKAKIPFKCRLKGDSNPVEQISFDDCKSAVSILNEQSGLKAGLQFALPTEAQWEYACRAGSSTRFCFGDDPDFKEIGDYMWYGENSGRRPKPVGKRKPNQWGLYDMHGNVLEWCQDVWGAFNAERVTDPTGPDTGDTYVNRGGYWNTEPHEGRSASRSSDVSHRRIGFLGVRFALRY